MATKVAKTLGGENILTSNLVDNGDYYTFTRPLKATLNEDKFSTIPYPEFLKNPEYSIDIPKDHIVAVGDTEDIVHEQYNSVATMIYDRN